LLGGRISQLAITPRDVIIASGVAFVVKVFSKRMRRMSRERLAGDGSRFMHVAQETINCHR